MGHGTAKPSRVAAAMHSARNSAGAAISDTRDDERWNVVVEGRL